jgi:putative transposase
MERKLSSVTSLAKKRAIPITQADAAAGNFNWPDGKPIDTSHMLISLMLPPAVKAFYEELERDVKRTCGARGKHDVKDGLRWGKQRGSAFFANQRVAVEHPRVRSKTTGTELVPEAYARFQNPKLFEQSVFVYGMKHVSQRDFAKGLPLVAASFGVSKSSVSRRWINATSKKLDELMERDLSAMDIVAIFIDGKRFKKHGVVVAHDSCIQRVVLVSSRTQGSEFCS